MHTPSMLTPMIANEVISDHAESARAYRATRRQGGGRIRRRRGRAGASRSFLPRGRTFPPFAH